MGTPKGIKMAKKPRQTQKHHRSYDPEIIEKIFKGEHFILSKMGIMCRKTVSQGFLRCLTKFLYENMDRAIELE